MVHRKKALFVCNPIKLLESLQISIFLRAPLSLSTKNISAIGYFGDYWELLHKKNSCSHPVTGAVHINGVL